MAHIIIIIIISERQCDALVEEQLQGRCVSVSCLALRCCAVTVTE
jgi:hypothetical protein